MYAHTSPPRSTHGYVVACTFDSNLEPSGSFSWSTQLPSMSNFQPWYAQRMPSSSLRPKKNEAARCGQASWISATLPEVTRKPIRFSPSSRRRTGGQSGALTSSDSSAGTQYCRSRSPMTVPGPTCVRASFSSTLSMCWAPPGTWWSVQMRDKVARRQNTPGVLHTVRQIVATAVAITSGDSARSKATLRRIAACRMRSVITRPGDTLTIAMLCALSSLAYAVVIRSSAALVMPYDGSIVSSSAAVAATTGVCGCRAAPEVMLTIVPPPCAAMISLTRSASRYGPRTLTR